MLGDTIRDHQAAARNRRAAEARELGLGWTAEQAEERDVELV
jgi:hypothetical protein